MLSSIGHDRRLFVFWNAAQTQTHDFESLHANSHPTQFQYQSREPINSRNNTLDRVPLFVCSTFQRKQTFLTYYDDSP